MTERASSPSSPELTSVRDIIRRSSIFRRRPKGSEAARNQGGHRLGAGCSRGATMIRSLWVATVLVIAAGAGHAQGPGFRPVTDAMLRDPSPNDWLMFSRTYDAQRFSPLEPDHRGNVRAAEAGLVAGAGRRARTRASRLVYRGVMYLIVPGANVQALDATNGRADLGVQPDVPERGRGAGRQIEDARRSTRTWSITRRPDGFIVALDARTGRGALGDQGGQPAATRPGRSSSRAR